MAKEGAWAIVGSSDSLTGGLYLLFAMGERPDRLAMQDFVSARPAISLSYDPAGEDPFASVAEPASHGGDRGEVNDNFAADAVWVELLREGLAFDLVGLSPGMAFPKPAIEHVFDLDKGQASAAYECLQLVPGHHLKGGERTMPVAKGLVGLARDMVRHFDGCVAVFWPPARSAIGRRFFESVTAAWLDGGPFPALGLTAFTETSDHALESVGLSFWIDQELRIEPPLSFDKVTATRLGVRLINHLVMLGGIKRDERHVAPDGTGLLMQPSHNGQVIRVWRE